MKFVEPMLAEKADKSRLVALCEDDAYYAQFKVDGDRLLMHVEDGNVRAMSRKGLPLAGVRKNITAEFATMKGRWVFDGEHVDNHYLIFDLIEGAGRDFHDTPIGERYTILEHFFEQWQPADCIELLPLDRTHEEKAKLASFVIANGCEGLVFKLCSETSFYRSGRSFDWLKVKFRNQVDAFVRALNVNGHRNMLLAVFRDGKPVDIGECTALAGDGSHVKVGDVVTVTYQHMSLAKQRLIQPTFPKIRHDKAAEECLWEQLVFEPKVTRV